MDFERFNKVKLLQSSMAAAAVVWTGILFGLYFWASFAERKHLDALISLRAESIAQHTQALRSWIGGHGGVYIEMNASGDERPSLLGNLPESEVITPTGRKLTLLSSSVVLGMIKKEFKSGSGEVVKLTSTQPMNSDNAPDEWEEKALAALEGGTKKVQEVVNDGQGSSFRLMYPMELQPRCLRCHEYLADSPSDIVGGLSIKVDRFPYNKQYRAILQQLSFGYIGIWAIGIFGLGTFAVVGTRLLRRIEYSSTHDGLTGLLNRREIGRYLTAECGRAERYSQQLSLLMLDLDHFKRINDTYGHQAGDEALRVVAETIRQTIRETDIAGRYGGEEFIVIAPETASEEAGKLAGRLNIAIRDAVITMPGHRTMTVTVSIGVSSVERPERKTPETLFRSADEALYRAKEEGRDRVVIGKV